MNRRTLIRVSLASFCGLFLPGCGRGYQLSGRIVSSEPGLPAGIRECTGRLLPLGGNPVANARVSLFHELTKSGDPARESTWQCHEQSNERGQFELFSYATPGRKNLVGLEFSAPGFRTQYTTYWDYYDPDEQVFFAVLDPAT